MNEIVFKTLKEKDYIIKNYLIKVATEQHLTLNELLVLVYFTNQDEIRLNIPNMKSTLNLEETELMEAFNHLVSLNLISVNIVKDENGKRRETINLDNIIKSVTSNITSKHANDEKNNLFELFEREFARTLSPMEFEIINDWINQGYTNDLIMEALKESIYSGTKSLRYINKILLSWKDAGYTSSSDVHNGLKSESANTNINSFVDYDWLNENN